MSQPLSPLERVLFIRYLGEHKSAEFGAKQDEINGAINDAMGGGREE